MIKRNGVELMNVRTKGVSIAKETLEVLKDKKYTSPNGKIVHIGNELDAAIKGSILYRDPIAHKNYDQITPVIEVTNETTTSASLRLSSQGKSDIVALNFASAKNPGGGFLSGATAQEEDLCRASGLYPCIKSKPIFYNENILTSTALYTDNIIYSPKVPFIRDDYHLFLEDPYSLSIITAPAPNINSLHGHDLSGINDKLIYETIYNRAIKILQVAEKHNHKNIILGAWGCGAFGNDSKLVSKAFMEALKVIPTFEHVCFAVYDTRPGEVLFNSFKESCK